MEGGYERHLVHFIIQRGHFFSITKSLVHTHIILNNMLLTRKETRLTYAAASAQRQSRVSLGQTELGYF